MLLYSPSIWPCYEELISFYPRYYREIYEMQAILDAFGTIFDALQADIDVVLSNAFIDYADEQTVARLEAFFEIRTDPTKTLEDRKRQIKWYYAGIGKVSASFLKEMLSEITDAILDITFEPFDAARNNRIKLTMDTGKDDPVALQEIVNAMNRWIPAHLQYLIHVELVTSTTSYIGIARQQTTKHTTTMEETSWDSLFVILTDENDVMLTDENDNILIL